MASKLVSIRARHCWRAMRRSTSTWQWADEFQSAPAIAGGRCHQPDRAGRHRRCFNPRPPLLAGDAAWRCWCSPGCSGFNPRPPLLAGDAWCWCATASTRASFNPRPPLLAGDAVRMLVRVAGIEVSIRARHCWRAMRHLIDDAVTLYLFQSAPAIAGGRCRRGATQRYGGSSFNPRPPLLAGDARPRRGSAGNAFVSIRARHCWRAMRNARARKRECRLVSIRARHCWRAMRRTASRVPPGASFQSAPAIAGGRCLLMPGSS